MTERSQMTTIEWAPTLTSIAREMGELAIEMARSGDVAVERKADSTKVTSIDKALNQLLTRRAGESIPGVAVWSEEGSTAPYGNLDEIRGRALVLGDPIDGTDKLVQSLEAGDMDDCRSTIMLAAFAPDQTIPEAAVVYAPFLPDRPMYWADKSGAYLESLGAQTRRLQTTDAGPTEINDVKAYKISRWNGCVPHLKDVKDTFAHAEDKRDALRLTAVAEGTVDLSIFPGPESNLHDIVPPLFIARQAGAATMGLDGRPFEELLHGAVPGVLAAVNKRLAKQVIDYYALK